MNLKPLTVVANTLVLSTLMMSVSASEKDIRLGKPSYAGSGCPAGSVDTALSPDGKTLTLLFDSYNVVTTNRQRKKCDLAVPIHLPAGVSVSLVDADYRGYVDLPEGAEATLRRDYFFAGQKGPHLVKQWRGKVDDDYLVRDELGLFSNIWSPCGSSPNLRTKTSLKVNTTGQRKAEIGVDSVDFSGRIDFHLRYRSCS